MSESTPFRDFIEEALLRDGRQPFSGSIELTAACNLRCRHCYMTPYRRETELTTQEVFRILGMLADAGCLTLLITGGEPLLRPDFAAIWKEAKRLGFVLTLFTNGTLADDGVAELLAAYPPALCEVSLYGASNATYADLCGNADGFDAAVAGLDRLRAACPHVGVKSMMLPRNAADMPLLETLCAARGLTFHYDTDVFPRLDGNKEPLAAAFSPEEGVERVLGRELQEQVWHEDAQTARAGTLKRLLACRAGEFSFHIGPYGDLCLCMLVREPSYDLRTGDFLTGWNTVLDALRRREREQTGGCDGCGLLGLCVPCIGRNKLETGDFECPAPMLCRRSRAIDAYLHGKKTS